MSLPASTPGDISNELYTGAARTCHAPSPRANVRRSAVLCHLIGNAFHPGSQRIHL